MLIDTSAGPLHLTYCTNVHPGESWDETFENLRRYVPLVKARVAAQRPFGLGLRLSALAARELRGGGRLPEFRVWLRENGLYVFTLNGFPYGVFHGHAVKDRVFEPDWRTEERVRYTLDLADVLAELLPPGQRGSISTAPLSYKPWFSSDAREAARSAAALNLARVAMHLADIERGSGRHIQLGMEPEPDGLLETTDELIAYFEDSLIPAALRIARQRNLAPPAAEALLRRHVGICFDTCHASVQYEEPLAALRRLASRGIPVVKVQVSAALAVAWEGDGTRAELERDLRALADPVYLHQVRQRSSDGAITGFRDLGEALSSGRRDRAHEWRIHFHVPLFAESYGGLTSTAGETRRVLDFCYEHCASDQLEIETYTWAVLPGELRRDLVASITAEFEWVLRRENACSAPPYSTSSA